MDYYDYIDDDIIEDYDKEPFTLDERYYDDQYYCPECGARKVKYKEWYEAYGSKFYEWIYECANCGY